MLVSFAAVIREKRCVTTLITAAKETTSMLAEIVRSSFTGRGDPSELYSHICRVAIFNPCQEL